MDEQQHANTKVSTLAIKETVPLVSRFLQQSQEQQQHQQQQLKQQDQQQESVEDYGSVATISTNTRSNVKDDEGNDDHEGQTLLRTLSTINTEGGDGDTSSVLTMQSGTTTTSFLNSVIGSVDEFVDTASEMFEDITDAFLDELHDADEEEDRFYFLEMSLTRNLSILPVDVVDSSNLVPESHVPLPDPDARQQVDSEEKSQPQGGEEDALDTMPTIQEGKILMVEDDGLLGSDQEGVDPSKKEREHDGTDNVIPLSAHVLLASAVISLSSVGPLLNFQDGVSLATIKVYWRTQATSIVLLPFAACSVWRNGVPRLDLHQWVVFLLAGAMYAMMGIFFVWSLDKTTVGNAVIFANSQSLLMLIGKIFVGERISLMAGTGAVVAFAGAVLCSKDSSSNDEGSGVSIVTTATTTVVGDFLALCSAICGVWYLVFAKVVRSTMDLYIFMFVIMFVGSFESLIFLLFSGEKITFDLNPAHGAFGWLCLEVDRLPLELTIVVVCNLFGAMGYVRAMHYFDNIVISVAALMEPVVAELMAVCLGVGSLPHALGWLGNALVVLGTVAVVYRPPHKSSVKMSQMQHTRHASVPG